MKHEDVMALVGKWGYFHIRALLLMGVPHFVGGFQGMMVILLLAVPDHRCRLPGVTNDTYSVQSEVHGQLLDAAIPRTHADRHHSCRLFVHNHTHAATNVTTTTDHSAVGVGTASCDDWVYDREEFESTVITEFDFVCDKKELRAHINMAYMIGILVGSLLTGALCDRIGRKPTFFLSILLNIVVGVLPALLLHPVVYIACRFLVGMCTISTALSLYVLAVELVDPSLRNRAGSIANLCWLAGPFFVASISYVARDWRTLQLMSVAPLVLCISYWWLLPESPRWLLSKGRTQEAVEIVRKAAKANGTKLPPVLGKFEDQQQAEPAKTEGPLGLFTRPVLLVRTLTIFFNWMVVTMTYYGLSLNVGNLGGSVRVNFLLSNTVELVGYTSAWVLLDRLGRKRLYCAVMLLAGIACLATIFTVIFGGPGLQWLTIALAMVGKFGVSTAFAVLYLMTAELFPTTMRNFGMGCSSTVGRVGSAVSPYVADLALYVEGSFGKALPLIVFGGAAVAAGLLSLLLPETLGRKLPDTIEEAVNFGKNVDVVETELSAMATETPPQSNQSTSLVNSEDA